jgi:hypothetical protein
MILWLHVEMYKEDGSAFFTILLLLSFTMFMVLGLLQTALQTKTMLNDYNDKQNLYYILDILSSKIMHNPYAYLGQGQITFARHNYQYTLYDQGLEPCLLSSQQQQFYSSRILALQLQSQESPAFVIRLKFAVPAADNLCTSEVRQVVHGLLAYLRT